MAKLGNVFGICVLSLCMSWPSTHAAAGVNIANTNEVIKADNKPSRAAVDLSVKSNQLEAFYYGMWGDETPPKHMFPNGRLGVVNKTDSCTEVRGVPNELRHAINFRPNGIANYYVKYTEAYGIPVLGSSNVSDAALSRACYVLRFLLADRNDLRTAYYRAYGRVAIISHELGIGSIPEYHFLSSKYGESTPGLGAISIAPVSTAMENNVLCWKNDTYGKEDILIREIAQGILHLAIQQLKPGYVEHLGDMYDRAMGSQWWQNTYAALTPESYFGEGVQSFFNVNGYSTKPNGMHNDISTRTRLASYDAALYQLLRKLWPCGNHYIKRCLSRGSEFFQRLNMDCPRGRWYSRISYSN